MQTRSRIILPILALAQLLVVLDASIINVALPAIKSALGFNEATLQWVLTAYILAFGGFLVLGGRVADLFGRRKILLAGVGAFTLTSLLIGLTTSAGWLVGLRAVQGLAAAFMAPAAFSILLTTFKEGHERNRALGVMSAIAAGGGAMGVFLGGLITQYLGWRWNFFVNVPLGALVMLGALRYIPAHMQEKHETRLDWLGALFVTGGMVSLVYGLTQAPAVGWLSGTVLGFLGLGTVLLAAFLLNEKRVKHPLIPLEIFRVRNITGANLAMLPIIAGAFGMFFFSSLYVQQVLGYSPIVTGLSFLPAPILVGILSMQAPRLMMRYGFKPLLVLGMIFATAGLFLFSMLPAEATYALNILPGFVLLGLGLGLSFVGLTMAATAGVPGHQAGLASGLLATSQQLGGAIGVAVLTVVSAAATSTALSTGHNLAEASLLGYQRAFLLAAIFMTFALLTALFIIREPKQPVVRTAVKRPAPLPAEAKAV